MIITAKRYAFLMFQDSTGEELRRDACHRP